MTRRLLLLLPGMVITAIGMAHIPMPSYGYPGEVIESIAPRLRDHFYYLPIWAICAFLLGQGVLSIVFALSRDAGNADIAFARVMALVWTARLLLEHVYPVNVPLYGIANPHAVLLPVLLGIVACYVLYAGSGQAERVTGADDTRGLV